MMYAFSYQEWRRLMSELKRFTFMIPDELKEQLKLKADSMGLTLSAYLRLILTAEVKK
jgi:antitoxin component of RelBE/YafQ-DinJ toxin-antitoxin module